MRKIVACVLSWGSVGITGEAIQSEGADLEIGHGRRVLGVRVGGVVVGRRGG